MVAKSLLLKGGAGLATAAAGGTGIYYGLDHFKNQLTEFDRRLIKYLEDDGKIQFAVTVGSGSALDNFPAFDQNSTTVIATIKVKTNGSTANTEGLLEDGGSAKKAKLKEINGGESGADWTWICEIKFSKEAGVTGDLVNKDKLAKEQPEKGFFNKLKDKDNYKDLKIKFIRDCAKERGKEKNREINDLNNLNTMTPANEIKSSKEFKLKSGEGNNTNKLVPENQSDFDHWFSIKEQK